MGNSMKKCWTKCCSGVKKGMKFTGNSIKIIFNASVKFCKDGLGKLGVIFKKSWSSFRNKNPTPYQDETYENPEKDQYKPGYYNIVAKPKHQEIGDNEAKEEFKVNYDPGVDPDKVKEKNVEKINFGADSSRRRKHHQRMEDRNNVLDNDILKVRTVFILFIFRNLNITNGLTKDQMIILSIILITQKNLKRRTLFILRIT